MIDLLFIGLILVATIGWSIGTSVLWYENRKICRGQDEREAAKLKERKL